MSERIVNDPSQHGWTEVNGKWVWEGGATTGHIEDGTIDGQITTWDVAKTEWTPEGGVVVDANGNVGIGRTPAGWNVHIRSDNNFLSYGNGLNDTSFSFDGATSVFTHYATTTGGSISFKTNPPGGTATTERMRIDSSGNVGIGPTGTLDPTTSDVFKVKSKNVLWFEADTEAAHSGPSNSNIVFRSRQTERMRIASDGRVDITGSLYVNGSEVGSGGGGAYVPLTGNSTVNGTITATDFIATSDERLKDDISPLPVGLIDDIKPVQWNWKDGSGKSAGVIAQQLQAIGLDDFVNEDADGNLGVNYNALIGILLAEVINLKAEVESLK